MKKVAISLGLVGVVLPLVILAIDLMTAGSYPPWSAYVWPTMIMLMPYGGAGFGFEKLLVTFLSIVLNGVLYAMVGVVIGAVMTRTPRK